MKTVVIAFILTLSLTRVIASVSRIIIISADFKIIICTAIGFTWHQDYLHHSKQYPILCKIFGQQCHCRWPCDSCDLWNILREPNYCTFSWCWWAWYGGYHSSDCWSWSRPCHYNDVRIGISDGSYYNQFYIFDTATNHVCYPVSGSHESNTASEGRSYYPGQVTMIFQPFYKYGSCYTGHDGGHVNVGTFSSAVDPSKGLYLQVNRHSSSEQYRIYYFMIEFL